MTAAAAPLAGLGILVTRPADQADGLATLIRAAGGDPVLFPALKITVPEDPVGLARAVGRLREYDLIIFVSPTAVERVWPYILERHGDWPHGFSLAAVGQGSLRALTRFGARHVLAPDDGADSESLLAMDGMRDVRGKRVLIVRGEGGRELLADTLRQRGAAVEYAECYRRARPTVDPAPLLELWRRGGIRAVTVTSGEALANLCDLLGGEGAGLLRDTPMFTLHERISAAARERGIVRVMTTPTGDEGLVEGMSAWFTGRHD